MQTLFKTFRCVVKESDPENGIVDMLIPMSTASVDRDGESIDPMGWKKSLPAFRKRPILLSSHNYSDLRKQIGEFVSVKVSPEGLFAKPKYYVGEGNEEADWAFKLASKGMAAFSVGFIPKEWEDGDGEKEPRRTYTEQELLEISQVVVPSNRDAIQGIRSKGVDPVVGEVIDDLLLEDQLSPKSIFEEIANAEVEDVTEQKVDEHKKHEVSQEEISDDIDYIIENICTYGLNEDVKKLAWDLVRSILRLAGNDIPEDIKAEMLKAAETPVETPKPDDELIQQIIDRTIKQVVKNS